MLNNWFQNMLCALKETTAFSAGCNVMYRKIINLYSAVNNTESLQGRRTKSQLKGSVKELNMFHKLRKSLVNPVTWQKTCNYISCSVLPPEIVMHDAFN